MLTKKTAEVAVSVLIVSGIAATWHYNRHPERHLAPRWASSSRPIPRATQKAVLKYLQSQIWASGCRFEILHASSIRKDADRFGPDKSRAVSVVLVEYLRQLEQPIEYSAPSSPEQFVFVIDEKGDVLRRLLVDHRHKPYGDLFGL